MKLINILVITALLFVVSPTAVCANPSSNQNLKPIKIIVELTVPDFLDAERVIVPRKKNRGVTGGGGRGVSHPSPETIKAMKGVWSYFYNLSVLKREKNIVTLDFRLSYEANGEHSINRLIEIKSGEVTEVEFQDGIKLKAYLEGEDSTRNAA